MTEHDMIRRVREKAPLIHSITNYVTAGDVANMLLAVGACPVMADGIREASQVTEKCDGLVLNLGTLNENTVESMLAAGRTANSLGHMVLLDPVGAGASSFRTETALKLIREIRCSVIRGNASEIRMIRALSGTGRGADAGSKDLVTEEKLDEAVAFTQSLSRETGAVIIMTGGIDLVSDSGQTYIIRNGHPWMGRITGAGCMLDGVIAAFCAVHPDRMIEAAAAAVAAEGLCGEFAYELAKDSGTGSFRMHLLDVMSRLDDRMWEEGVKIEIR